MAKQLDNKRLPLRRAVLRIGLEQNDLNLVEILREKSGADRVEIDQTGPEPAFVFEWGDDYCLGGPPWAILAKPIVDRAPVELPMNMRAANAREQAVLHGRCQAVRAATSLVWCQFMARSFDRVVSMGAVVLYARPQAVTAEFVQIPADVWSVLHVVDWERGIAVAPNNTAFFSICVEVASDTREAADVPPLVTDTTTNPVEPSPPSVQLRPAPETEVRNAVQAEYDEAKKAGRKPPNINEIQTPVQERLKAKGYRTSGRKIAKIASEEEFDNRRLPSGQTWKGKTVTE